MACSTCRSTNTTCGCKDTPLTTAPVYTCPPDIKCPDPTPCYETIQDTCVKHSINYSIVEFGKWFAGGDNYPELAAGASLEQAYQAMSIESIVGNARPPLAVHPSYVGTTAIIISWEDNGSTSYTFQYSTDNITFTSVPLLTTTSYTLINLVTGTDYYFKVTGVLGLNSATGATIKVTTL
jgi:hypothetical protein